mmetsp:Transcript_38455/g.76233  ORF Transcript_38455/g.76233 Transcript_38455/m.76233 type:complete len:311 (+) Transcript_38455:435-1367(+)
MLAHACSATVLQDRIDNTLDANRTKRAARARAFHQPLDKPLRKTSCTLISSTAGHTIPLNSPVPNRKCSNSAFIIASPGSRWSNNLQVAVFDAVHAAATSQTSSAVQSGGACVPTMPRIAGFMIKAARCSSWSQYPTLLVKTSSSACARCVLPALFDSDAIVSIKSTFAKTCFNEACTHRANGTDAEKHCSKHATLRQNSVTGRRSSSARLDRSSLALLLTSCWISLYLSMSFACFPTIRMTFELAFPASSKMSSKTLKSTLTPSSILWPDTNLVRRRRTNLRLASMTLCLRAFSIALSTSLLNIFFFLM